MCSMEEVDEIARRPNSIPISCQLKLNMDGLLCRIWDMMALVRGCAACAVVRVATLLLGGGLATCKLRLCSLSSLLCRIQCSTAAPG